MEIRVQRAARALQRRHHAGLPTGNAALPGAARVLPAGAGTRPGGAVVVEPDRVTPESRCGRPLSPA